MKASLLLLAVALTASVPAWARDLTPGCLRTIEYHCSMSGSPATPARAVGAVKLQENMLSTRTQDPATGYEVMANISANPSLVPTDLQLSVWGHGAKLATSITSFGSDFIAIVLEGGAPARPTFFASCAIRDRQPDANGRTYISFAPPPVPQVEQVRPRPGYIWIPGYWQLHHHKAWGWQPGYWERQRAGNKVYEPGAWFACDGRYAWADGRWITPAN